MSNGILTPQASPDWADVPLARPGGILVATDASPESDGALRAAALIAVRSGQPVSVLAVHTPLTIAAVEAQLPVTVAMEPDARAGLADQVREQMERLGVGDEWRVWTISGEPASAIASTADAMNAGLIVMGLGGHSIFDRLLGDETALRVLRLGRTPVLAVAPSLTELPRKVLAAVDFSASSGNALSIAGGLIARGGTLTVAHVLSHENDAANWTAANAAYRGSVGRAIDRMLAEAAIEPDVSINRMLLSGEPKRALLSACAEEMPDLVVTGSHGHNFLTRLRLGSVSTRLLRDCGCTILVAPPDDAAGYLDEMPEERGRFACYEWAERLEEFTRRNAGRTAMLEVIDPELGAQVEEIGLPFVGASFDPFDARLQLMFGRDLRTHLTRNIPAVTGVQLLRDRSGRDRILRVAHGRGQTLLTLER